MTETLPPHRNTTRDRIIRALCGLGVMVAIGLVVAFIRSTDPGRIDQETIKVADVETVPLPPPVSHAYAGSQSCVKCHAEVVAKYAGHPMAQAMATVNQASPLEDYSQTEFSPAPDLTYYVERQGDQVFHHEVRKDADGNVIYDQGMPVHFACGSGARGRTYLINDEGRLTASMISWYADGNTWGLSPGYRPLLNERFERRCSEGCISCHAGLSTPHDTDANRFANPPFVEMGISCERCHGPAQDHITFHESAKTTSIKQDPIINPIDFTDARRDAVCNQCHLLGRRRVVNYGRTEFDFRPGMYLGENWTVFVKTEEGKAGLEGAVSQVEQMHASQCYQKSGNKLSCIDCHDPHGTPAATERVAFYREKCLSCHQAGQTVCSEKIENRRAATAEDSCIVCHMPSSPAKDVHAPQTDHRVTKRRTSTTEQPAVPWGDPTSSQALFTLFKEPGYAADQQAVDRAKGIYISEWAVSSENKSLARETIDLLIPWIQRTKEDPEALLSLGNAFQVAEQSDFAIRSWNLILEKSPTHEDALEALAVHYHQSKEMQQAKEYYQRLLQVNPTRSTYYGRLAHVLGQLGDFEAGKVAAKRALELNPSLIQTNGWLLEVAQKEGDEIEAKRQQELLDRFHSTRPVSPSPGSGTSPAP